MKTVPLKNINGYFACTDGYIIKPKDGKDIKVPIFFRSGRKPYLMIKGVHYELLTLLMDAYNIGALPTEKIKYKIKEDGNIPVSSIRILPFISKLDFVVKSYDDKCKKRLILFGCETKAYSANSRCGDKITAIEIFESLKLNKFRCFYCGTTLFNGNWHLDHYIPISKGGLNKFTNVVPSCPTCNMMKSDIDADIFVKLCERIYNFSLEKRYIINK